MSWLNVAFLVTLAASPIVGAVIALRALRDAASRWGLRVVSGAPAASYRGDGDASKTSRHAIPLLAKVAAAIAGSALMVSVLFTVALATLFVGVAAFGDSALLALGVSLPVLALPVALAVSLGLYLRALLHVHEETPHQVQLAVFLLAVVGVPAVLSLAIAHIGALLLAVPFVGSVLVLAAAAHQARDAALAEARRQQAERDALRG